MSLGNRHRRCCRAGLGAWRGGGFGQSKNRTGPGKRPGDRDGGRSVLRASAMIRQETTRRGFFRGVGLTTGTMAGLGLDLAPVRAAVPKLKIREAREVPSICPYCAVGCSQIVSVRDGSIVNIEGNPDSPINRGTLCPKGSATYQLVVNPNRLTKVKYRKPYATEWEEVSLDWAMDRIATLVKQTREATFEETWKGRAQDGT